mgnify:CR=1 FL=1
MQIYHFSAVIKFETDQHWLTTDAAIFDADPLGNVDQQSNRLAAIRAVLTDFLHSFSHVQLDCVRTL